MHTFLNFNIFSYTYALKKNFKYAFTYIFLYFTIFI